MVILFFKLIFAEILITKFMIQAEIYTLYNTLVAFLGESKRELDETYQIQFNCPRCIENKGNEEKNKYNLEVNIRKGVFKCWSCAAHDDDMHGSIKKLFKLYGNEALYKQYNDALKSLRETNLYKLNFSDNDFIVEVQQTTCDEVVLPKNVKKFKFDGSYEERRALEYLRKRGINDKIINEYNIYHSIYDENLKKYSSRIIIPSYDSFGSLNYWTGRDFTGIEKRQKYYNPNVNRKDIVFNEEKIQWDADITLVEGPFDHIVVPNSIPLLGKVLKEDYRLFKLLFQKANAKINIFLDGDAFLDVKKIYSILNHDRLINRIRYIPTPQELDPSEIFKLYGCRGIAYYMKYASQINGTYF